MKKTHIAILVAFVALCVAVAVFLPWGILTHKEPGFTNPRAVWGHIPLTVGCRGYTPQDGDACDAAEEVVSRINHRIGRDSRTLLRYQGADSTADIEIVMRAPVEVGADEPGGNFVLVAHGERYEHCTVRTMNASGGANDMELLTLYHEIGHCLGLDHDDESRSGPLTRDSIMRPVQEATRDRVIPNTLTDWDVNIIRDKYEI